MHFDLGAQRRQSGPHGSGPWMLAAQRPGPPRYRKGQAARRDGALGIGSEDLEIGLGAKGRQSVPGAELRVAAAGCRRDAEEPLEAAASGASSGTE